ncbi:MAG: restriction endonuclease subunit S [Candidatus Hydrogenedentes bacterium]|nr:restriction endonuclease subunit S [Candidatus Hydrogenedentota bacterium]
MSETAQVRATHASPQQRELPSGWRWVKLGEVCEIIAGQSPPGSTYRTSPEGLPFFQGKADFGLLNPVPRVWCVEPNKIANPGDILISVRAPVGPTNVANMKCCIGRGLAAIQCGGKVDSDFILAALRRFENKLVQKGSGSTFEAISRDDLEKLAIPLPPLIEQRRIAGVLREQMAVVEKARAAAQGRLEAVKALPAAFLRHVFPQLGQPLPAGWRWVKLGEVCEFLDHRRKPINEVERAKRNEGKRAEDLYPYYGANGQAGWIDDYLFDEPLILLAEDGGAFGSADTPIAYKVEGKTWVNNHAHVLRPRNGVDFDYCLASISIRPDLANLATGNTRPKLNQALAAGIPIPLPPLAEQRRIAGVLREQMAAEEKARAAAEEELNTINALPAALLHRAFNGEI